MFSLDPTLAADSLAFGEFDLCSCRVVNNMLYPWFLLVPKVDGATEIIDLSEQQQVQLLKESAWLTRNLKAALNLDKMNIAALGNQVPQLHVHHIARYKNDAAWPKPVWGSDSQPYTKEALERLVQTLREQFAKDSGQFVWCDALQE